MHGGFRGLNRQVVHHFDGGRQHARSNDVADGGACLVCRGKGSKKRVHALRPFHDAQCHLGGDPQCALRADKYAGQIISGRIQCFPAEMHKRTIRKDHLEPKHVRCGKPVFQAMRTASVFRDISANTAYRLRRWVGRVEIFIRLHAAGNIQVEDAGLDHHARILQIHFQNAVHARQTDDDSVFHGKRPAAQSCPRATRDEGDPFAVTDAHDGLHLWRVRGKQHG